MAVIDVDQIHHAGFQIEVAFRRARWSGRVLAPGLGYPNSSRGGATAPATMS